MAKMIIQKKFPVRIEFRFETESFSYAFADTSGEHAFMVAYEEVATDPATYGSAVIKLDWYQHTAVAMAMLALLQVAIGFLPHGLLSAAALAVAAGFLYAVYRMTAQHYTLLGSEAGAIRVMVDAQQENILQELVQRRQARLRIRFAEIDFGNELEVELQKFAWLLQQGVISQEEYEAARHQLMFAHAGVFLNGSQQLN